MIAILGGGFFGFFSGGAAESFNLLTEDGDALTTEDGDNIVTEDAP